MNGWSSFWRSFFFFVTALVSNHPRDGNEKKSIFLESDSKTAWAIASTLLGPHPIPISSIPLATPSTTRESRGYPCARMSGRSSAGTHADSPDRSRWKWTGNLAEEKVLFRNCRGNLFGDDETASVDTLPHVFPNGFNHEWVESWFKSGI